MNPYSMLDEGVPQRIGRYEIIGRLAAGGMAEVLLGRLHGPHGFERPVVIKRILPQLALDSDVVAMFLDEARIIASLRHPNLIHVHELGHEGKDLFIAMEYLEGESLSGVCRRLAKEGALLSCSLAAHIVAEACSGLHAAHEAKSSDGRPLEIVHRDVSPQNILVSYAGDVHVIDFGIATTVDRIGRTEKGTVRGKFEYLSPEQLHSVPLDRRADIFGLGVVLFELASGRRAFKRDSQAQTMMAILTDTVPTLSSLRAGAPDALQAICTRALEKGRRERFQTAAEMRRELLAFTRVHAEGDLGEELAAVMRGLFAERIAEKDEMLKHVRQGARVASLPAAEVDIHVELPTAEQRPTGATALSQSLPTGRRPRELRWLVPAVVSLAVAGIGTVLLSSVKHSADGVPTAPSPIPPYTVPSAGGVPSGPPSTAIATSPPGTTSPNSPEPSATPSATGSTTPKPRQQRPAIPNNTVSTHHSGTPQPSPRPAPTIW
jgi:serine/threonine protein kinase